MSARPDDVVQLTLLGEAAQNADCAVFVVSEEGEHIAANDCASELLGYSPAELRKMRAHELGDLGELLAAGHGSADLRLKSKAGDAIEGTYSVVATRVASLPYRLAFFTPAARVRRRRKTQR